MFNFTHRLWFKNLLLVCGLAYLTFQCGFCAFVSDAPLFIRIIGWAGLVFFGGGGVFLLYKVVTLRSRGLRMVNVSDEGLILLGELIPWSVIEGFEPMKYKPLQVVNSLYLVRTNNCEEIIANTRNPLKRWSRRRSLRQYGAIYVLDDDYIDGSIENFVALCNEYIENDRKKRERFAY